MHGEINILCDLQLHMKRYAEMVINLVKKERLFADQGGPIIMAQVPYKGFTILNEQILYIMETEGKKMMDSRSRMSTTMSSLHIETRVKSYIKWAANMAVSLYNGVPWVMCKQKDAPPSVVSVYIAASTSLICWGWGE